VYLEYALTPNRVRENPENRKMGGAQPIRYLVNAHNTLIIRGPAAVQLLSGNASVLGARFDTHRRIVITREKQLPVETESEADLDILLGNHGEVTEVEGSTIPNSWTTASESLTRLEQGKIIVIGSSDVGKSTFCTYLANSMLEEGIGIRILDGDIGQADIGPPTTIGSAGPTRSIYSLTDLKPDALLFLGDTTPGRVETKLIEAIQRLATIGHKALTIINTDGWTLGQQAVSYKMRLIEIIQPDLVIGISASNELRPILESSRAKCLQIHPSKQVFPRTRNDRRQLRTLQYRKFLNGATTKTIRTSAVLLKGSNGQIHLRDSKYTEYAGLIAGLLDEHGLMLEIGVTLNLDPEFLKIYTRSTDKVQEVEFGQVKLTTNGVELGYLDY